MVSLSSVNTALKIAAIASLGTGGPLSTDDYSTSPSGSGSITGAQAHTSANAAAAEMTGIQKLLRQNQHLLPL